MQWWKTILPITVYGIQGEFASIFILLFFRPTPDTAKLVLTVLAVAIVLKMLGFDVSGMVVRTKRYLAANSRPIYYNRAARRRFCGYL